MKKLSRKELEIELMESDKYGAEIYFMECQLFIKRFNPEEFKSILDREVYCRGLVKQLNKMLLTFENMEAYEFCAIIRDYLESNKDVYLY